MYALMGSGKNKYRSSRFLSKVDLAPSIVKKSWASIFLILLRENNGIIIMWSNRILEESGRFEK